MLPGTPAAEFAINDAFVAQLIADQHPDLRHLPLRAVDSGWDNAMFRLGDHLAVRLPRRAAAANLIAHEQRWLPHLASGLSLPVPALYRCGTPAYDYPWHWSIVQWLPGEASDQCVPMPWEAKRFGAFLRSLHVSAPADAPPNILRGVPLSQRAPDIEVRMKRLAATTNFMTNALRRIWHEALQAPIDVPPTWLHGDLHPRNVLVENGTITGIVDWGDITSGDRATDLASIWMLFDESLAWREAITAYGELSRETLLRAQGWAIFFGVVFLDSGRVDQPRNIAIGERTLHRVAHSIDLV